MKLGGFLKQSVIDFPGRVSCVVFFSGCNFQCPYCHNPGLARGELSAPDYLTESWIFEFLEQRKNFLDGVAITGGEPTLQADLIPFCRQVKQMGFEIKLDTNGSRPKVLASLFEEGLLDYVAMDIKADPLHYPAALVRRAVQDECMESIRMIMESGVAYEFRTTCVRPFVNADVIRKISEHIHGARRYCLQQFRETDLLQPDFFQEGSGSIPEESLEAFRSIAAGNVGECIVR